MGLAVQAPHLAKNARLAELPACVYMSLHPSRNEACTVRLPVLRPCDAKYAACEILTRSQIQDH